MDEVIQVVLYSDETAENIAANDANRPPLIFVLHILIPSISLN